MSEEASDDKNRPMREESAIDDLQRQAISIALDELVENSDGNLVAVSPTTEDSSSSRYALREEKLKAAYPDGVLLASITSGTAASNNNRGEANDENGASSSTRPLIDELQDRAALFALDEIMVTDKDDVIRTNSNEHNMSDEKRKAAGVLLDGSSNKNKNASTNSSVKNNPPPSIPGAYSVPGINSTTATDGDDSKYNKDDKVENEDSSMVAHQEGLQQLMAPPSAMSGLSRQNNRMVNTQPGVVAVAGPSTAHDIERLSETVKQEEKVEEQQLEDAVASPISAEIVEQEDTAREEIAATKAKLDLKLNELETMTDRLAEMELMRQELDALRSKVATVVPAEAVSAVPDRQHDRKVELSQMKRRRSSLVGFSDREIEALQMLLGHDSGTELPKKVTKEPKKYQTRNKMSGMPTLKRIVSGGVDDATLAATVSPPDDVGTVSMGAVESKRFEPVSKNEPMAGHAEVQLDSTGCCVIL